MTPNLAQDFDAEYAAWERQKRREAWALASKVALGVLDAVLWLWIISAVLDG
ncbi:MAG: hypothetical protein IKS15_05655 [Opitutales bacterium]|nr:hypothetical protein [Opitutales bacterium]